MTMPSFEESSRLRRCVRVGKKVFDLASARKTLPLLKRVLADVVAEHAALVHEEKAAELVAKRAEGWNDKRNAFRLADSAARRRRSLADVLAEAKKLGVEVLDPSTGTAAFPSIVNGALAFLVVRHEDEDVLSWRYRDQPKLRPIPRGWYAQPVVREPKPQVVLS